MSEGGQGAAAPVDNTVWKKWVQTPQIHRFCNISRWYEGNKFSVEIGTANPDGKLTTATKVYVDVVKFYTYLESIKTGTATALYPPDAKVGIKTAEGFASYGGYKDGGKAFSRIFKTQYWTKDGKEDLNSFVWKAGVFGAKESNTGAFMPNYNDKVSDDMIKMTRYEIVEVCNTILFDYIKQMSK